MYLIIDLGNTNKKMAVLPAGKLLPKAFAAMQNQVVSSPEISRKSIKEFTRNRPAVEACILSSVVPFPASLSAWLGKQFRYLELSEDTPLPILNLYRSPATLGNDRLAAAVAGACIYPHKPVLVVSAGTALTYDLVTAGGEYVGGSIAPGMGMRFRALHTFTKQIPLVSYSETNFLAGNDTRRSVRSGVINGMAAEMEGMIARYRKENPGLRVILSGGDMNYFVNRLKISIFAVPNIVIYGLQQILAFNDKKPL
jgi:type III pantothenate kinase